MFLDQATVVQKVDGTISSAIGFTNTNPLDRDLSDEQLGPVYSKFEKFRPYEKQSQAAFSSRYVVRHDYSAFLRWII